MNTNECKTCNGSGYADYFEGIPCDCSESGYLDEMLAQDEEYTRDAREQSRAYPGMY